MADDNPVVLQRQLQTELRRLREERGLTQRHVAVAHDWSTSKLIRLETGATRIGLTDLRALLQYYEVRDPSIVERLTDLAVASRARTWRDDYRQRISPPFFAFLGYEAAATRIRHIQSRFVPGLLQTQKYTRTIAAACYGDNAAKVDLTWEIREQRQGIIQAESRPPMTFLLDESVLRRQVGEPDVMRDQLEALLRLMDTPARPGQAELTIQYVPFKARPHSGTGASFIILDIPPGEHDRVVYVEEAVRDILLPRDAATTGDYVTSFATIESGAAATPHDTKKFIETLLPRWT